MKNESPETLYNKLKHELENYNGADTIPITKAAEVLSSIRAAIAGLRNYLMENPFEDPRAEIVFFKYEKPKFLAEQIYALEVATIEMGRPAYDETAVKGFLLEELRLIRRFLEKYRFLFHYYKMNASDLDNMLFMRGAVLSGILLPATPDRDPLFSTNGDFPFAKFIAYERLQEYLIGEIKNLEKPAPEQFAAPGQAGTLKWTGETINLVELAYGIWLTGQVNNGNASITEITEWLEVHFRVKIGKAHRRWQSIAQRKRLASFKYVDDVKDALLKRLDDEWEK
jgi:hypothetical protein